MSKAVERCDFCGMVIPEEHTHLLDLTKRRILCACEACTISQAKEGEMKPVPKRYLRLVNFTMPDDIWDRFRIPVDMAFFFLSSATNKVAAFYPSPMGPTECQMEISSSWQELEGMNPVLKELSADVEALLVKRTGTQHEYYLVPIDECYKLVGLMRSTWRGITGGPEVFEALKGFFDDLRRKSSPSEQPQPA